MHTLTLFHLTDLGNAQRFARDHHAHVRYTQAQGWMVWTGTHWQRDETGHVERAARATVRDIYKDAYDQADQDRRKALADWARKSESHHRIKAMLSLAQSEELLAARIRKSRQSKGFVSR